MPLPDIFVPFDYSGSKIKHICTTSRNELTRNPIEHDENLISTNKFPIKSRN